MATKDEALKMAIEYFESIKALSVDGYKAEQACREALAQPAQEPVAWMYQTEDENFKTHTLSVGYEPTFDGKIIPLYTHPTPSCKCEECGMKYCECGERK